MSSGPGRCPAREGVLEDALLPSLRLDVTDEYGEELHRTDSLTLLCAILLLALTIITVWIFKAKRIRVCHETGLAIIYGIIFGAVIRFAYHSPPVDQLHVVAFQRGNHCDFNNIEEYDNNSLVYPIGEEIVIQGTDSEGVPDGDALRCVVTDKVYDNPYNFGKNSEANPIQKQLLFDPEFFFFVLLPPIIFQAGYGLKKRHFFRNIGSLLTYAFIGTTVSCFVVGGLMYGYVKSGAEGIYDPNWKSTIDQFGIDLVPSLLFGALISATDPVTVLAVFHDLHVDYDLYSLVFGESVMNDAVAIVLFGTVDQFNREGTSESKEFTVGKFFQGLGTFLGIFIGSFVLGIVMALVTALVLKFSKLREHPLLETSMFILLSYATYVMAEAAGLTGIVAVLFCGIGQSHYTYINLSDESKKKTKELFELLNFIAENFVFSYMGISLFVYSDHQWLPGFILFAFVAILIARIINIYVLSLLLNIGRREKISFRFQHMLVFAGLRGAIAFALAIRNTHTATRQLIFTTTLIIVIITVFVNGGLTTLALQLLKIKVDIHESNAPYVPEEDKRKGNWLVRFFAKLDRKYLLPLFTHQGDLSLYLPQCCHRVIPCCNKCRPQSEDFTHLDAEESIAESNEDIEGTLVFHLNDEEDDATGDIGLGNEAPPTLEAEHEFNSP